MAQLSDCHRECLLDPQCAGASFDTTNGDCALKDGLDPAGETGSIDVQLIYRTCHHSFYENDDESCSQEGLVFNSEANLIVTMTGVSSASVCRDICLSTDGCLWANYAEGSGTCSVRDNYGQFMPRVQPGITSVHKNCISSPCEKTAVKYSNANDYLQFAAIASKEECWSECAKDFQCAGSEYDSASEICKLKTQMSIAASAASTVTSTLKHCRKYHVCS